MLKTVEGGDEKAYRSEKCVHEFISRLSRKHSLTLKQAHDELGNDTQMFPKVLPQDFTICVVVVQSLDLGSSSEIIKSLKVEIVDMRHVGICDDHIRKILHVAQTMCNSDHALIIMLPTLMRVESPCRKFLADISGRFQDSVLGELPTEDGQLPQAHRTGIPSNPSKVQY